MEKKIILFGSLLAALAVGLGAFGAHGLEDKIAPDQMLTYETAVQYHFYHVFALLFVALLSDKLPQKRLKTIAILFGIGILCFSGSLYLLATKSITGISGSILGPITPIGGTFFIAGWLMLAWNIVQEKTAKD